jgi:hypothetical protein
MAVGKRSSKMKHKYICSMDDKEIVLLSIITMNGGILSEIQLKRIYMEKFTLWELQATEKMLSAKGLLVKNIEAKNGSTDYVIPNELIDSLHRAFSVKGIKPHRKKTWGSPQTPFGEYSILRSIWRTDTILGVNLMGSPRPQMVSNSSVKKVEEALEVDWEKATHLVDLLKHLSESQFIRENGYKNWRDVLNDPCTFVKEVYSISYDMIREGGELGPEDVGKDNIDFLFEELSDLKFGHWYLLEDFVSNTRATLFSANQPFRWIHFDIERIWFILDSKLKILGVTETLKDGDGNRYIMLTALGAYCLGEIPEAKFLKKMAARRGKLLVHPNFEVTLVARETNPKKLLELAMFTEPVKLDTMSVFRITRDSVKQGKRLGLTTSEMIEFLRENSKGKIPQNVEYSIGDWGR